VVLTNFPQNSPHSHGRIDCLPFTSAQPQPVPQNPPQLSTLRTLNEAELTILRRAEAATAARLEACGLRAPSPPSSPAAPPFFRGAAFRGLAASSESSVARTSLQAKKRWERALRTVLIMVRLTNALR